MTGHHPLLHQIRDDFDDLIPSDLRAKGLRVHHIDKGDGEDTIGGQVLCGVPEKIRQLIIKKTINLQRLRYVVVDEADSAIMGDKQNTILAILKLLIRTGNEGWKMIICGATIDLDAIQNHFRTSLDDEDVLQRQPHFFDMKLFNYEILLDNIFHFYHETSIRHIYTYIHLTDTSDEMDDFLIKSILHTMEQFDKAQIMVFFNGKMRCEEISRKLTANKQLKFLVDKDLICEVRSQTENEIPTPRRVQ
jgi:superfamily II DNA/RNA helicase